MRIFYFARIDIEANDAGARHVLETCKQFASIGHETVLFIPNLGATRKLPGVSIVSSANRHSLIFHFTLSSFFIFYIIA